jgi:hypothetical protein
MGREIHLTVSLFGKAIDHPHLFLNEARLAIAIYLGAASLVLKTPTVGADSTVNGRLFRKLTCSMYSKKSLM